MEYDLQSPLTSSLSKNKHFSLCASLSNPDLIHIWDCISNNIYKNLQCQRGVSIHGLGVFSFEQNKLDVGGNKFLLIQRPIFQLAEKFCQTHGLKQTKYTVNGAIPVPPLNFSALSIDTGFDRDSVDSAVREMISALNRSVAAQKSVEFTFNSIGRLHIRSGKAKFKFFKDLVQTMENGGKVIQSMQDRPGTADSVMSERPPSRAFSVSLPVKDSTANQMKKLETIPEDGIFEEADRLQIHHSEECHPPQNEMDDFLHPKETDRSSLQSRNSMQISNRVPMQISTASDFELHDLLRSASNRPPSHIQPASHGDPKDIQSINRDDLSEQHDDFSYHVGQQEDGVSSNGSPKDPFIQQDTQRTQLSTPPTNNRLLLNRSKTWMALNEHQNPNRPSTASSQGSSTSSCGHPLRPGQELCYLCHQRALKNVPISFKVEFKKREEEEDRLIQAYQQIKDNEYILTEQEKMLNRRHDAQKNSAFNLGIAEAVRQKNDFKDPRAYPSYIMKQRPLTPPKSIKQQSLKDALLGPIEMHRNFDDKLKTDENFLGKLEQIQLAEELAAQRRKHLEEKLRKQQDYNDALGIQIRSKPEQIPGNVEEDPKEAFFGKNDMTEEKLL
jgi:nucleoid DNA-binding protein